MKQSKEALVIVKEALDYEGRELSPEQVLSELDEWDSMARLSLMISLEEEFGKEVSADDIRRFVTIKDIIEFVGQD